MADLKRCPFCGGEVMIYYSSLARGFCVKHRYGDSGCILLTPILIRNHPKCLQDAYEAWNRRTEMADLIERSAAIDALDEQIGYCDKALASFSISAEDTYAVKAEKASLCAYRKTLEYMPSAQPERKTGHWVEHHEPYTWMGYTHWSCSECGYGEEPENHNRTNYCPNCGAKMDGGDAT